MQKTFKKYNNFSSLVFVKKCLSCLFSLSFCKVIFQNSYFIDIQVNKYKIHPNYEEYPDFDIAILDTERIDDGDFVPVCLTNDITPLVGYQGSVLSYTPISGNETQQALYGERFSVVLRSLCDKVVPTVPEHSFCVNHGHRGSFLCNGDSGSGFVVRSKVRRKKRYFLHGVVSTSRTNENDCTIGDFVIFTHVTKFMTFVTEN